MNAADAVSAADLDGGEFVPTYYCEACGCEIRYPSAAGCCALCDAAADLSDEDEEL